MNLYYRGIIEDMQAKYLKLLDIEALKSRAAEEAAERAELELRTAIEEYKLKMEEHRRDILKLREEVKMSLTVS